jgi:GTP pyrophosphokinase
MINQEAFFKEYGISNEVFEGTNLKWTQLTEIFADYKNRSAELLATGRFISDRLSQIKEVHSLKVRVKDPEHLIEKIIRKKVGNPAREINLDNYKTEITDLVGVRALHLFKDDWEQIHKAIVPIWELHEQPTAYIRDGDYEACFEENGCTIIQHKAGYRSVHYLVKSQASKQLYIAEIQVRTLFEEGWSEIDHRMRYPYDLNNLILSEHLGVFNRLAGNADEMGTVVRRLKAALEDRERVYNEQLAEREAENAEIIKVLKSVTERLEKETDDKEKLKKVIETLEKQEPTTSVFSEPLPTFGFGELIPGQMVKVNCVCTGCGAAITELPFMPSPNRPVRCRACHAADRALRPSFGGGRY